MNGLLRTQSSTQGVIIPWLAAGEAWRERSGVCLAVECRRRRVGPCPLFCVIRFAVASVLSSDDDKKQ